MSGNRTRLEAKAFWGMVQDRNCAKPPGRQIQEGTSCGTCSYWRKPKCTLKGKVVQHYNICSEWKE